ncbi:hypothetical protein IAT38_006171 [Cryptococcus sp. DSM 104549]
MSLTDAFTFPHSFVADHKSLPPPTAHTFPSPPPSVSSDKDASVDFDLESFTHYSPDAPSLLDESRSVEYDRVDLSPASTDLVSPRSSIAAAAAPQQQQQQQQHAAEGDTAEALSNHHLQRYLHYKALAARAEADRAVAAHAQASTPPTDESLDALFAACDKPGFLMNDAPNEPTSDMLAYHHQQQLAPQQAYYESVPAWGQAQGGQAFGYHPQSSQAALHNAQAQAHLQAADAARYQAEQHRSLSMSSYYLPQPAQPQPPQLGSARSSFDAVHAHSHHAVGAGAFPRQPLSNMSTQSPPYPSTPTYPGVPSLVMAKTASTMSGFAPVHAHHEMMSEDDEGEDELAYSPRDGDVLKPMVPRMPIPNAHGGGRGYVPGQTPDDPKKRHKCTICGRGFARAFNLKSHVQTHNPMRPKPYQCPHSTCKRGFSRLHDLERHRQGIHSDGPLVDAKRHGVAPAVARAQSRIQKRAESGSLI